VEHDVTQFAEWIAPILHIKYRFVGEEPEDVVTRTYNEAMKRILTKKGIEVVEIPRKEIQGRFISASMVRRYLKNGEIEKAYELVPDTTKDFLMC